MSDCIFCKIIAGEIPSATIYENDEFKVILDRFPAAEGHVLILPKNHTPNIFEIDPEQAGRLFTLAAKLARALKEELGLEHMNVLQNNGTVAGQTVFHFHLHLILCFAIGFFTCVLFADRHFLRTKGGLLNRVLLLIDTEREHQHLDNKRKQKNC